MVNLTDVHALVACCSYRMAAIVSKETPVVPWQPYISKDTGSSIAK